jgi:hypothetical protein
VRERRLHRRVLQIGDPLRLQFPIAWVLLFAVGCSPADVRATDDAAVSDGSDIGCNFNCVDVALDGPLLLRVKGVLDQVCASPDGCHGSAAGNLPLSLDHEFVPLIDVYSYEVDSMVRVKPWDPVQSYLYLKLACDAGYIVGECMPKGGHLDPALVQAFHDWIEAGAPTQ